MSIKIDDGPMSLEIGGRVIATARERTGGVVGGGSFARVCHRNQADSAVANTAVLGGRRGGRGGGGRRAAAAPAAAASRLVLEPLTRLAHIRDDRTADAGRSRGVP